MLGCATVTILVPQQLCIESDTLLCGSHASSDNTADGGMSHVVVITGASAYPRPCLGCINNGNKIQTRRTTKDVWVELQTKPQIMLQSVRMLEKNIPLREVNLVIYDAMEICSSEFISKKFPCGSEKSYASDIIPYLIHCVQRDCKGKYTAYQESISITLMSCLISLCLFVSWIPKFTLQFIDCVLINRLDYSSTSVKQIILRITQLEKIQEELQTNKGNLLSGRLLLMILIDVSLGITIACVISSYASVNDLYTYFRNWTKVVAEGVHMLLEWLRGAPAGLKLNQPLTQALASFFSYHVHLWHLYLDLAEPVLRCLAWVVVWVGAFGASAQVAVLADLLDLASLHLYCFYIYAARIHMLQISVLGSQWRAFRGRKWNPLKQRVDGQEGISSVGTLGRVLTPVLFTLALFLLPTTSVYYLVFVTLRIGLHMTRGLLTFTIWLLNINPLYLLLLNVTSSTKVKGDIYFSTVGELVPSHGSKHGCSSPLLLKLHTWTTPLCEVIACAHLQNIFPPRPAPQWKYILTSIMFGQQLL